MPIRSSARCGLLLLGLTVSGAATAAEATSDATPWYMQPVAAMAGAVKAVGSVWTGFTTMLMGGDPHQYLPSQISEDDRRFFATLDALGLQLSEIKVGGGTLSPSSYRFVASREPSDVDVRRAEQKLADYRASTGDLRTGAKQRIARAVLDVAGDKGFVLTAVVVDLWPWPAVKYEMTARSRPPESSERRVIEASQQ